VFGFFETGLQYFYWGNALMLLIGGALIYLGIAKKMEPLLLVPIGFGILLINLPLGGLMDYELQITHTGEVPDRVISIEVDEAPNGAELDTKGGSIEVNRAGNYVKAETMGGSIIIIVVSHLVYGLILPPFLYAFFGLFVQFFFTQM